MTAEIERKSLVANDGWRQHASEGSFLQQIYLVATRRQTVHIRTIEGRHARLTVKIRTSRNRREEYEYDIPYCDAQEMFGLTRDFLRKTRYEVNGYIREVDVYSGQNRGLVVAEVELDDVKDTPSLPEWLGPEITGNELYSSRRLIKGRPHASGLTPPCAMKSGLYRHKVDPMLGRQIAVGISAYTCLKVT